MANRPVPRYDFKSFGEAIKDARKAGKNTQRRQLDALLDDMSGKGTIDF